jgi:hypothetical protein
LRVADGEGKGERLALADGAGEPGGKGEGRTDRIAFYAVAPNAEIPATSPLHLTVPLYEFRRADGSLFYATDEGAGKDGAECSERAVCRVWPCPTLFNPYSEKIRPSGSPFDVPPVRTKATTKDILRAVRESRTRDKE